MNKGSRRLKRVLTVGIMSAALAVSGMAPVEAHSFSAASNVTIGYGGGSFSGSVTSNRARCERGRTVKVKKVRPGPDKTIGSDTTNSNGGWSLSRPNANGSFYAKVIRRVTGGYGHTHRCNGDTSATIQV